MSFEEKKEIKQAKVYRDRREKLAAFLEQLPDDRLDMAAWVDGKPEDLERFVVDPRANGCGTTGCIAGYAAAMWPRSWRWVGSSCAGWQPIFRDRECEDAFAEFMGITEDLAILICIDAELPLSMRRIRTPQDAAAALRELNEAGA